jgi:fluoride exporter
VPAPPSPGHPRDPHPGFPVDPDVTPTDVPLLPQGAGRFVRSRRRVLGAISVGGAIGALARWALAEALPHDPGRFPWSTFSANVAGCFMIGVLMVLVVERWSDRPLVRPFLGTGVLGGFTTFSTYAVDTRGLLAAEQPALAATYLVGTLLVGLLAVVVGLRLTERVLG